MSQALLCSQVLKVLSLLPPRGCVLWLLTLVLVFNPYFSHLIRLRCLSTEVSLSCHYHSDFIFR